MKFSTAAVAVALCSTSALAKIIRSDPFKLVLINDSNKFNGTALEPCHLGAAIEGLCPVANSKNATTYIFQYIQGQIGTKKNGPTGDLFYSLPVDGNETEKEALTLYADPSTNVALGLFVPGIDGQQLAFDNANELNLQSGLNDTVNPPTSGKAIAYYRWFVCKTNFEGYVYNTLNWVYGKAAPQNPTCVSTTVKRVFVQ